MTDLQVDCVAPVGDRCGEAVVWSAAESAVYWVDVMRYLVHRLDLSSGSVQSWHFDEPVVALALTTDSNRMLVALASRLIYWWPATDIRQDHGFRLDGYPRVRLNDGRADPLGNFWLGSMKNNLDAQGELTEAVKGEGNRVEPVCSAFDLGPAVSTGANPIAAGGYATAIALCPDQPFVTRYRIAVQ